MPSYLSNQNCRVFKTRLQCCRPFYHSRVLPTEEKEGEKGANCQRCQQQIPMREWQWRYWGTVRVLQNRPRQKRLCRRLLPPPPQRSRSCRPSRPSIADLCFSTPQRSLVRPRTCYSSVPSVSVPSARMCLASCLSIICIFVHIYCLPWNFVKFTIVLSVNF